MTVQSIPSRARAIAVGVAAVGIVLALLGIILGFVGFASTYDDATFVVSFGISGIFYSVLGALIIARYPRHVIGMLFVGVGFMSGLMVFGAALQSLWFERLANPPAIIGWLERLGDVIWIPALFLPMTLVLQYFPNGRLPSRRWWPLPVITVIWLSGLIASEFGISMPGQWDTILAAVVLTGSLAAVVVHFRRSQGLERQQIKWLVYAAVVSFMLLFLATFVLGDNSPIVNTLFIFQPSLLAIVMGFAVLRYRLFDIDVIIRKTLQYGVLTAILALVYFGLVILLQTLFSRTTGEQSPIIIVISTLAIAALFSPLRRRIQDVIDRHFYRRKYNAEQVLADFARHARDETDLDALLAELGRVVEETMQSERVGIWIRKNER